MGKLIKLHPADNILIVKHNISPGDEELIGGVKFIFDMALGFRHKIAAKDILARRIGASNLELLLGLERVLSVPA